MNKVNRTCCTIAVSLCCCTCAVSAEEYSTTFERGKWNPQTCLPVKSPRFNYMGDMVQMDDHITNRTPDLPDDVILKKHGEDVYSCIMLRKKFTGNSLISSTMSFDHRMAPLIVIAGEIGKSAKGEAEHREHYEVVLFDEGINIWHHTYRDGKPGWYKAAFLKAKFLPKKRYDLQVKLSYTKRGKIMTVTCDGKTFGYTDNNLPDSYYAGLIGCEGRNRFYDFKVKQ